MGTNPLVGKTIRRASIADDNKALLFELTTGELIRARCDGDCCSSTWIESVEGADVLLGEEVVAAEDIQMPSQEYDEDKFECVAFYGFKITTKRGSCVIDYRNESNGYYGGNLEWPGEDSYYYGGVHGQNVSTETWKPLADQRPRRLATIGGGREH